MEKAENLSFSYLYWAEVESSNCKSYLQFTEAYSQIAVKHAQGTHKQNDTKNLHNSKGT